MSLRLPKEVNVQVYTVKPGYNDLGYNDILT
jgi:hypothetical protein